MRGRITRRGLLASAAATAGALAVRTAPARAATPVPDGGGASVGGSSLVVNVRATAQARVRARAWPSARPEAAIETPWVTTNRSNAARIAIPGASVVGQGWSWQGDIQDPLGVTAPVADAVRTVPAWPSPGDPSAFAFAFGSCITHAWPAPAATHALDADPRFFALLGDMDYVDWGLPQNYMRYSKWFRNWMIRPEIAPIVDTRPILAVQDDHDYGLDECWAATVKTYAAQAFADLIPGAPYPAPTYRRWSLGEVDVWLLDCRRYKDPKPGQGGTFQNGKWMSVLRRVQRSWLLNGMAASTARVKVVLSPISFSFDWSSGERALVTQWVTANVAGTVIFCSGDRHAAAFVHSTREPRIWELLAGPLNNEIKHPVPVIPGLVWAENPGGRGHSNAVGIVEVDSLSATPAVTLRAVTDDGSTLHAETVAV
jgi:hypothetical protein